MPRSARAPRRRSATSPPGPRSAARAGPGSTRRRAAPTPRPHAPRPATPSAAHADGPPQHRHARHDEGFYVVSGTARFTVADTSYDAPAGTFVMIPPGAPHTFANPGGEPAVVLNTFTPDLYVQYFRDLRD